MSVFLNKEIYYFLKNPKDHFAYRLHVADDLADKLKQNGITCLTCKDNQMQLRLKFYGISKCDKYTLNSDKYDKNGVDVTIFHKDLILYRASVTKAHKKKI
jgi:hypothetical protein